MSALGRLAVKCWLLGLIFAGIASAGFADEPWFEQYPSRKLTEAQKKRLVARANEQAYIKRLYPVDIDSAVYQAGQSLQRDIEVFGEEHHETARSMHFLASSFYRRWQFKTAVETLLGEAQIYEKVYGVGNWRVPSVLWKMRVWAKISHEPESTRDNYSDAWDDYDKGEDLRTSNPKQAIAYVQRAANTFNSIGRRLGIPASENIDVADTLLIQGRAQIEISEYDAALKSFRDAMAIYAKRQVDNGEWVGGFGDQHPTFAGALGDLGRTHWHKGEYSQAEMAQRQALDVFEKCYEVPTADQVDLMTELAQTYYSIGNNTLSRATYDRALKAYQACDKPYNVTYGKCLIGLSECHRERNEIDLAEKYAQELLEFSNKKIGADSITAAVAHTMVAHCLADRRKYQEAFDEYTQSAQIQLNNRGAEHVPYARCEVDRGWMSYHLGKLDHAEKCLDTALNVLRGKLSPKANVLRSAVGRYETILNASVEKKLADGDFDGARSAAERVVNLATEARGNSHWTLSDRLAKMKLIETLNRLSPDNRQRLVEALEQKKQAAATISANKPPYDEALASAEKSLATIQELASDIPWLVADGLYTLADVENRLQRFDPEEKHRLEALAKYRQAAGSRDLPPRVAQTKMYLAFQHERRNQLDPAVALLEEAQAALKAHNGRLDADYLTCLERLGQLRDRQGRLLDAEYLLREATTLRKQQSGANSWAYLNAADSLASILLRMRRPEEAIAIYEELSALFKTPEEKKLPRYLDMQNALALSHRANGDLPAALKILIDLVPQARAVLPGKNFKLAAILCNLGTVQLESDQLAEAEGMLREGVDLLHEIKQPLPKPVLRLVRVLDVKFNERMAENDIPAATKLRDDMLELTQRQFGVEHWRTHQMRVLRDQLQAFAKRSLDEQKRRKPSDEMIVQARQQRAKGDFVQALSLLDVALSEQAFAGTTDWQAVESAALRAELLETVGRNSEASKAWQGVLTRRQETLGKEHPVVADVYCRIGTLALRTGNYSQALDSFQTAREILAKHTGESSPETAVAAIGWGEAQMRLGKLTEAAPPIRAAVETLRAVQIDYPAEFVAALVVYSKWYAVLGDDQRSYVLAKQAADLARRFVGNETRSHIDALQVSGEAARCWASEVADNDQRRELLDRAKSQLELAVQLSEKVCGAKSVARADALCYLALLRAEQGGFDEADRSLQEAGKVIETSLGPRAAPLASVWQQRSELLARKGELAEAAKLLQESRTLREELKLADLREFSMSLRDSADLAWQQGDRTRAADLYRQYVKRSLADRDAAAAVQVERQQLLLNDELRDALDAYLTLPALDDPVEEVYQQVLAWKGASLANQIQLRRAARQGTAAPIYKVWQKVTADLASAATRLPTPEEGAFWLAQVEYLTLEKERLESELIRQTSASKPALPTVEQISALLPADTAIVDLVEYIHREPLAGQPGKWTEQSRLAAFVIRRDAPRVQRVMLTVDSRDLDTAVRFWQESTEMLLRIPLSEKTKDAFSQQESRITSTGLQIFDGVWKPLRAHLDGVKTVLISPDGSLSQYSFAGMPVLGNGAQEWDGKYLLEQLNVATIPAVAALPLILQDATKKPATEPVSVCMFGGIDFRASPERQQSEENRPTSVQKDDPGSRMIGSALFGPTAPLTPLTRTGAEVDDLEQLVRGFAPSAQLTKFKGSRGTENAFRAAANQHRWLFMTTHGFFSEDLILRAHQRLRPKTNLLGADDARFRLPAVLFGSDLTTGLALAGANEPNAADEDDGVLWAMEIAALDLSHLDLIVLSACETAKGRTHQGEGVFSMQRAFEEAGARTVLSTLWPVDERASMLLMQRFHANLLFTGANDSTMSKIAAFSEAQRWMLNAARRTLNDDQDAPTGPFDKSSPRLPGLYSLPLHWSAFVLTGDWR